MIRNLGPLLLIPDQNPRLIERLDFRPDLQRGDKGVIYRELATVLRSGLLWCVQPIAEERPAGKAGAVSREEWLAIKAEREKTTDGTD